MVTVETLGPLLHGCLSNDNATRSQAEEALKGVSAQPAVVTVLMQVLQAGDASDVQVRLLAAVILKKRAPKHWGKLDQNVRQQIQNALLELLVHEKVHPVLVAEADCVSCIARIAAPKGEWPNLLPFLEQCSKSGDATHREVALILFGSLAEAIGDVLQPAVLGMQAVVQAGLGDASLSVRRAALSVMEPLSFLVSDQAHIHGYHALVASMLNTAQQAVQARAEDIIVLIAQIILSLCENPAPLLQPHLPTLIAFSVETACYAALENDTREQALQVLNWIARYKPKQLTRNKAVMKQVVSSLCMLCCEPEPPEADKDGAEDISAHKMAAQALDTLALNCAPQHVFPPVMAFAKSTASSSNPSERLASMTVIALISEGCAESMRKHLKDALPMVLQGLQDPEQSVRGAAAFAIGQFSEFLQPDIVEHYQTVLPAVFAVMHDPTPGVQERACYALDAFCEHLEEEILPYLPQLVEKLVEVLRHGSHAMQDVALSALASTVAAAGKNFEPYVATLLPILHHFIQTTTLELLPCRCHAIECAGLLIESLGDHPAVGPLIPGFMQLGLAAFPPAAEAAADPSAPNASTPASNVSSEVREYWHGLFARVAKSLGSAFSPYLQGAVHAALDAMKQEDVDFPSDDDDEEEENDGESGEGGNKITVRTGVMDEKSAAAMAIGYYAQAVPTQFGQFLAAVIPVLTTMLAYFHEDVRAEACGSLAKIATAVNEAYPPQQPSALSQEAQQTMSAVGPLLVGMLEDEHKVVVAAAFQAVAMVLNSMGLAALGPALVKVSEVAALVLKGQAPCQEDDDEEEEGDDADEVSGEREEELLTVVAELLPVLAKVGGADAYAPVFASAHLPPLLSRFKPLQPDGIRAAMSGCVAEVAEVLQGHMASHLDRIVPHILREIRADDSTNRQNAAFCVGALALGCGGQAIAPFQQQLLQALFPLFQEDEAPGTMDNAAGAVARMMLASMAASTSSTLPVEQIIPVFLGALPLKEDVEEGTVVYSALSKLVRIGDVANRISSLVPNIVQAFGAASVQRGVPTGAGHAIGSAVAYLVAQYPAQMQPLIASLPVEQQQALSTLASNPNPAS